VFRRQLIATVLAESGNYAVDTSGMQIVEVPVPADAVESERGDSPQPGTSDGNYHNIIS